MDLSDITLLEDSAAPAGEAKFSEYMATVFAGKRLKVLDEPTKRALVRQAQAGDIAARNKLVEHDMPLIIQQARRYLDKGLAFEDLVQAGTLGLMTAIDRFDLEMGVKLNTYTVPYILKEMRESLYLYSRTIRLPKLKYQQLYEIRKVRAQFEERHGRYPLLREVAAMMDLPPAAIDELMVFNGEPSSFENIAAMDHDQHAVLLGDTIMDEDWVSGEDRRQVEDMHALLPQYIARLRLQYQVVLTRRFGFHGEPMLHKDIAEDLGVTRARVQQIEVKALKELRAMIEYDGLTLSDLL